MYSMIPFCLKPQNSKLHVCITMGRDNTAYVCMREERLIEGPLKGIICVCSKIRDH